MAAILHAQLKSITKIQKRRKEIWFSYEDHLAPLANAGKISLPYLPDYASVNGHIFYILAEDLATRDALMKYLNRKGIQAVFHYLPLHQSPYFHDKHDGRELPNAISYANRLIRLPFFYELSLKEIDYITSTIRKFFS